jgi:phage shock protein PspC (stress-responsive transcriptional regulator)
MNKTENVSIGRQGFVCEQGAYKILHDYLERSSKTLNSDPDKSDILADLESSMAGHISELSGKLVVDEETAKKVVELMGEVSVEPDTASNDSKESEQKGAGKKDVFESFAEKARSILKKPIHKDKSHKVIDGVCSGLANSLEVDALWVRLSFVLLSVLTKGGAVGLYIILTIVMSNDTAAPSKTAEQVVDRVKEKFASSGTLSSYEKVLRRFVMGVFRLVWGFARFIVVATLVVSTMVWASTLFFMLNSPSEVAFLGGNIGWLDFTLVFSAGLLLLIPLFELITSMFRLRNQQRLNMALWSVWALSLIVAVASFANVYPKVRQWAVTEKPKNRFIYVRSNGDTINQWCFSPLGTCSANEIVVRYENRCGLNLTTYHRDDRANFLGRGWVWQESNLSTLSGEKEYCEEVARVIARNGGVSNVMFADNIPSDPVYFREVDKGGDAGIIEVWGMEYMTKSTTQAQ